MGLVVLLNTGLSSCNRPLLEYEDPNHGGSSFVADLGDWHYGLGLDDGRALSLGGGSDEQGSFGVVPYFASNDSVGDFVNENVNDFTDVQSPTHSPDPEHEQRYAEDPLTPTPP